MDFANKIDDLIRTKDSKKAFGIIDRLTIVHPTKRDGRIIKCLLNENDELVANDEDVQESCLNIISILSGLADKPEDL